MTLPFASHAQTRDGLTVDGDYLEVTLKTEELPFEQVLLRCEPDNEECLIEMQPCGQQGRLTLWRAQFRKNSDQPVTHYLFKLLLDGEQVWLDARGVQRRMPGREYHFKYNAEHQPPSWVAQQVFYQIFPERFCNGNPALTPQTETFQVGERTLQRVAKPWGEATGDYQGNASREFFGGDLAGIQSKLDYLQQLGVTALYLNPLFESFSNHKYDTNNYYRIDPHFGTNQEFTSLSDDIHQRGMKLVLDAVVNHTSVSHEWFDISDHGEKGAYHHPASDYRDYYFFNPDNSYVGWKGIATLPVLNFSNPALREHVYQGPDSVLRHWLKAPYHIDGWRFDVIHMLGEGEGARNNAHYVEEFRRVCKEENPDAYVLGEHFFEATQWLQGDQEDGAMNYYGFAHPLRALLAGLDISHHKIKLSLPEFADWLLESKAKVPWLNQLSQLNQLDSHDTRRFLTMLGGDRAKMRMAATLLFTYVGAPCIYYGTEVGLEGGDDPDNRRCFPWQQVEHSEWLPFFTKLVTMRKSVPELQTGSFTLLDCSDDHLVFSRELGGRCTVVMLSLAEKSVSVPLWKAGLENEAGIDQLDGSSHTVRNGQLELQAGAMSVKVIRFLTS